MSAVNSLLLSEEPVKASDDVKGSLAQKLSAASGLDVYPDSIISAKGVMYALGRSGVEKTVLRLVEGCKGETVDLDGATLALQKYPCNHETAVMLRAEAPFLGPTLVGNRISIGMGDRLGIATPGHLQAVRGTGIVPIIAQQSIREMERTNRTPDDVMDCATYGALEAGWVEGFGSDADHLKTTEDVDYTMAAGFTMFTIDPRDHVNNDADALDGNLLRSEYASLPWDKLDSSEADTLSRYSGREIDLCGLKLTFGEEEVLRAAVKYGKAVAHTVSMYNYVAGKAAGRPFEFEMSVDETDSPTTTLEHYYFASELNRLGAKWSSLAPRFIGEFEKGVDYIGDLEAFEKAYVEHCKVAEHFGNYKISVHSGSDKFSIYGICARNSKGHIHVKTAGTSYLEALRTIAVVNEPLFLEILEFCRGRYEEDRQSYHVSAVLDKVVTVEDCAELNTPDVLDRFDTREALHVTFGSVLTADDGKRFKEQFMQTLRENEEKHYEILRKHFRKHIEPMLER